MLRERISISALWIAALIWVYATKPKVYIISDNFAVGWADRREIAAEVIRDLYNALQGNAPTLAEVEAFFIGRQKTDEDFCTFIGWIVEKDNALCFRWKSNNPGNFEKGDEFFEGAGNVFFYEIKKPSKESGGNPFISSALGKLANLLSYEIINGKNLQWRFGGAYQLVYHADGRFQHLTSATFVFFIVRELDDGRLEGGFVPRVLKFQYDEEVLKIMAVSISKDGPFVPRMYYAYPIHTKRENLPHSRGSLSLNSDYDSILINITARNGAKGEFARTSPHYIAEPALVVTSYPEGLETLDISNKVFADLKKNLEEMNQNPSDYPVREWRT